MVARNNTVCKGIMRSIGKVLVDSFTSSILSPDYFCEELAPTCEVSGWESTGPWDYVNRLIDSKPAALKKNDYINKLYDQIKGQKSRKTIRAVHFSDPHVDEFYRIGADS